MSLNIAFDNKTYKKTRRADPAPSYLLYLSTVKLLGMEVAQSFWSAQKDVTNTWNNYCYLLTAQFHLSICAVLTRNRRRWL